MKPGDDAAAPPLAQLLAELEAVVRQEAPHLQPLFATFAEEAASARAWLQPHLQALPSGARVLEVGAGLMLLSCQLAREGYEVAALEPIGAGFGGFQELQALVLRHAQASGIRLQVLPLRGEDLRERDRYDFAFSVNVMEHVDDVAAVLAGVTRALKPGATYAFTCPNYRFPYEPHFGFPTLGSKRLTERVFARAIRDSRRMADPAGVWRSLNWITVGTIARSCRRLGDVECRFDRAFLARSLARVTSDPEFASRRAAWMRWLARLLVATRLHRLGTLLPASLQPGIDCTVSRRPVPARDH